MVSLLNELAEAGWLAGWLAECVCHQMSAFGGSSRACC